MLTDTALRIFKPKASMRSESRRLPSPLCLVWEADFFGGRGCVRSPPKLHGARRCSKSVIDGDGPTCRGV